MKMIGLGIGLLLFAILLRLCSTGIELVPLAIGLVGLIPVLYGSLRQERD